MKKFFIDVNTITSAQIINKTISIPIEHKTIKGLFLYGKAVKGSKIAVKLMGKEILPSGFDSTLIEFTGNVSRDNVMFPLNIPNDGTKWEITITPSDIVGYQTGAFNLYFEAEGQ